MAAVVTGSSRGIGATVARALGVAGMRVAVHWRSAREEAEAVCADIRAAGGAAVLLHGDIAEPAVVERLIGDGTCAPHAMGGRRHFVLLAERDWLLARVAAAPDLTVRALRAELIGRGTEVSYGAVWDFLAAEGLTYKKNAARHRAGTAGRGAKARAVEASPGRR